ncbi:ParA family protein [Ilyobacter sp.]|jgi:chromosome partitioning protein|uniref:ParA family protein n=1 Tax=Ilyobacter sp. TaxID=3100343 RepID=UPI003566FCBE
MLKIAIANNKGGVAKTTSALNLMAYYAQKGYKVLGVDLDPQGNLSDSLGINIDDLKFTAYEALKSKDVVPFITEIKENLSIVASNLDLERGNLDFVSMMGRELLLKKALKKAEENYDICIIDTSPSLSTLTLNALAAADTIYIPLRSGYFEMRGSGVLIDVINDVREDVNPDLKIGGVFLTQYDSRTNMSLEVTKRLEDHFGSSLLKSKIRNNIALAEAPALAQDIFTYKPTSNGSKDYKKLAEEILKREGFK